MLGAPLRMMARLAVRPRLAAALASAPGPLGRALRRSQYRRAFRLCAAGTAPTVLVYTMSKVASSAVTEALQSAGGLNVFQVHVVSEASVRRLREGVLRRGLGGARRDVDGVEDFGGALAEELIRPGHPLKVVTLVREPIARNASFYFQILDDLWQTGAAHEKVGMERLLAEYHERFSHERTLDWFDEEFRPTLGVDVYEHPFPREAGFLRIDSGPYEVLVMRHDLDDRLKEGLLSELAGVRGVTLAPRNVGARKNYSAAYREFLRRLRLPEAYVDHMLDSRYARHFYTAEELARVRAKWLGARAAEPLTV